MKLKGVSGRSKSRRHLNYLPRPCCAITPCPAVFLVAKKNYVYFKWVQRMLTWTGRHRCDLLPRWNSKQGHHYNINIFEFFYQDIIIVKKGKPWYFPPDIKSLPRHIRLLTWCDIYVQEVPQVPQLRLNFYDDLSMWRRDVFLENPSLFLISTWQCFAGVTLPGCSYSRSLHGHRV